MHCAVDATTKHGVTTYTDRGLSDGDDITTLRDANGNQANCFNALSVGSNRTLTIPNSYTGPIYIDGGSVDFKGTFNCTGCNAPGSYSLADILLSGTTESGGTLPDVATNKWKYYDFVSTSQSGGKNFLIASLTLTAVPEPSTWAMILLGFAGIGVAARKRRSRMMQLA